MIVNRFLLNKKFYIHMTEMEEFVDNETVEYLCGVCGDKALGIIYISF